VIVLDQDATFDAPVQINMPGRAEPVEVSFTFRALRRKRVAGLMILTRAVNAWRLRRANEYLRLCWRTRRLASVVDMIDEFTAGWQGIEPAYSRDALKALLQEYPGTHVQIYLAFLKAWQEERLKN